MIRRSFNFDLTRYVNGRSPGKWGEALDTINNKYRALGTQLKHVGKGYQDSYCLRTTIEASGEYAETWAAEIDRVFQNSSIVKIEDQGLA